MPPSRIFPQSGTEHTGQATARNRKRKELVFHSINKSLSKFGPDSPALLVVQCIDDELAILLNFPGYPVSSQHNHRDISYTLDQGSVWRAKMQASNDFSTLGLWNSEQARQFLQTITGARELHVETRDSDDTQINATFGVSGLAQKVEGLCNA